MKRFLLLSLLISAAFVAGCDEEPAEEVCVPTPGCVPNCSENSCGDDGCGCSCGDCVTGYKCRDNQCVCALCGGDCGECPEIEWMPVAEGTFEMGCTSGSDRICSTPDFLPVHEVTMQAYEVSRHEVTAALYARCLASGACLEPGSGSTMNDSRLSNYPVNYVKWSDAEAFCMWAGGRLGSEAEWEYAARGTDGRMYPWGNAPPTCTMAWIALDGCQPLTGLPGEVGTRPLDVSPWGIEDMAGNVFEWVADPCHEESYEGAPTDGSVWESDVVGSCHVQRGGAFTRGPETARAFNRVFQSGDEVRNHLGIRCFR
jgi:serine/threonine-protein kinase